MAAIAHPGTSHLLRQPSAGLDETGLTARLEEEIDRAARHGTSLSCLRVRVDNLGEIVSDDQDLSELTERALACMSLALRGQLRRFDRVGQPSGEELIVILPGSDGPRGELVARRALARLRAIKVEVEDRQWALRISVAVVAWRHGLDACRMLSALRAADVAAGGHEGHPPRGRS